MKEIKQAMKRVKNVLSVVAILMLASRACGASSAEGTKSVRLLLPSHAGPVVENIGRVFAREIQQRCEAKVVMAGDPNIKATDAFSRYDASHDAGKAHDGILASDDEQNFWASANHQDAGSWWQADLGEITAIPEIHVQFRAFGGRYHFVPKTITFQVSDDGNNWRTIVSKSAHVPAIGSAPNGKPYAYDLKAKGRYVRLLFEDGTEQQTGNIKVVELVDVKVGSPAAATPAASADPTKIRLPAGVLPVLGCWFWNAADGEPENFKPFIDGIAQHTAINIVTESIRIGNRYMTDPDVIEATQKAATYARTKGIGIAPELGPWSSFPKAYSKEPLQMIRLVTTKLADNGEVTVATSYRPKWNHLQGWPFEIDPANVARVYSYVCDVKGIEPKTIEEITTACKVEASPGAVKAEIPCGEKTRGREACVLFSMDWQWPDPFNPKLPEHIREYLAKYADVGLAGACLDEYGLPAFAKQNELWYSPYWAAAYADQTKGRDLLLDMLLIVVGEKGREGERHGALNHYMEMTWQQHGKIENNFYEATKETFGADAFVGTHPTWIPHLDDREIRRNGLDWWAVRRDYGQTDEITPYCLRTALAKKWGKSVGYNMYYSKEISDYEKELWQTALVGIRVNYHPIFPSRKNNARPMGGWDRTTLWEGGLMRGDCRVRLLNFISKTQVDCPVAVIFGHGNAINWAGASYADAGDSLANAFWGTGFYADLIPSSEIESGALHVDEEGAVRYGNQKYAAVVLYHPQFEKAGTGEFFRKAAKGKTALYRIGNWTRNFEGEVFDGNAALPSEMVALTNANFGLAVVIAKLRDLGIAPQTPAPARSGQSHLIDGTVILTAGEKNAAGDPIQKTIQVNGHDVIFDAIGVAAVKLAEDGTLEAMAAGGLKTFAVGETRIELPKRADVALWKDEKGIWQGVLQDYEGDVPEILKELCKNWLRLKVPEPYAAIMPED